MSGSTGAATTGPSRRATSPYEVRLLSVADQFEALTAARPYRAGMTPDAALALLYKDAGSGVDPAALGALEAFLTLPEAAPLLEPAPPSRNSSAVRQP